MSNTELTSPFGGTLQILRRPRRPREVLQAWDSADLYLLQYLADQSPPPTLPILLVNDRFGALACALAQAGYRCESWGDSAVAHRAMTENAARNQLAAAATLAAPDIPAGCYSHILLRLPKSHSLLRYQLEHLLACVDQATELLGAGMVKHIEPATVALLESIAGPTRPSLAWKKARLIHFGDSLPAVVPQEDRQPTTLPEWQLQLYNRANVFSRGKLDRGSRLLISAMPSLAPTPVAPRIADLGCGNGLLGILALGHWPQAKLHFFDDSYMAVDSARENLASCRPGAVARFSADDCMTGYEGEPFDLVLCNPPFHQEYDLGDQIARQMFRDAHQHLAVGGKLCVVGNRHLNYHTDLKRLFDRVTLLASDPKFVVLLAEKTH